MTSKHIPPDVDPATLKPCARRIHHENVSRYETSITWCTLPSGHDGPCSGPLPSIIELNHFRPRSR